MKTNNVLHAIAALNLEPIKNKLMDAEHGEGWSRAKVEAMDLEYRRFLHLMYTFPNEPASPTKAVDTFWHYHILDTQKSVVDCDEVFGCFLHHNPYGDEASANSGVSSDERMQQLYEATFGEAYIRAEAYCLDQPEGATAGSAGRCQTVCMMGAMPAGKPEATASSRCQTVCMMGAMPAAVAGAARDVRRSQTIAA